MPRTRRVSPNDAGWTRRRVGRGFAYLDENGNRLPDDDVARVKALAIPPAWSEVWICRVPNGHLQAVGIDAAGRRQYLYHPDWRARRDELKFERVTRASKRLPAMRVAVLQDLADEEMTRDKACAAAVRLLDLGCFRIGNDAYANGESFGLTTLERRHVRRIGDTLVFDFTGKSGIEHHIEVDDEPSRQAIDTMRRRRDGSERLLAYREGGRWVELDAPTVNLYLRDRTGEDLTAKDFRTWHATVLAAAALAESDERGDTRASRQRAIKAAVAEVAEFLGNTATIARSSYIDPRVIDLYEDGVTISTASHRRYRDSDARQAALERAVRRMLSEA
ncbi:DNA topoisomerase I [Marmoricola sp. URHA0025 HA25]